MDGRNISVDNILCGTQARFVVTSIIIIIIIIISLLLAQNILCKHFI